MIKTKTQEIISENAIRRNVQKQNFMSLDQHNVPLIPTEEMNKKFEHCEQRINSFENVIEEILNFTKKTWKDIHDIQINLSNQNILASKANNSSFIAPKNHNFSSNSLVIDKNESSIKGNPLNAYKEINILSSKNKKLDDTVNYNSNNSSLYQNNYLFMANKPLNKYLNTTIWDPKITKPNTSLNSIQINGSIDHLENSPICNAGNHNKPHIKNYSINYDDSEYDISKKIYKTCDSKLNNETYFINTNKENDPEMLQNKSINALEVEEHKILQMEIELLKKKLTYYAKKLDGFVGSFNDKQRLIQAIEEIQQQLDAKICDLRIKQRHEIGINNADIIPDEMGYNTNQWIEELVSSDFKEQPSCAENISRCSINTFKTNATIPNEYDGTKYLKQSLNYWMNNITKGSKNL